MRSSSRRTSAWKAWDQAEQEAREIADAVAAEHLAAKLEAEATAQRLAEVQAEFQRLKTASADTAEAQRLAEGHSALAPPEPAAPAPHPQAGDEYRQLLRDEFVKRITDMEEPVVLWALRSLKLREPITGWMTHILLAYDEDVIEIIERARKDLITSCIDLTADDWVDDELEKFHRQTVRDEFDSPRR